MSNTPRMDSIAGYSSGIVDAAILAEGMNLERELNAANYEVQHLREAYIQLQEGNERQRQRIKRLEEAGNGLLWYFCPKNTGDISFLQSEAIKQWNKAKEAKL